MAKKVGGRKSRAKKIEEEVVESTIQEEIVDEVENNPVKEVSYENEETIDEVVDELNTITSGIDEKLTNLESQDKIEEIVIKELTKLDEVEKKIKKVENNINKPKPDRRSNNRNTIAKFWNGMTSGWYE